MANIESTEQFTTSLSPTDVRDKVLGWAKGYTYKVEADEPTKLVVYTGSQVKMRLLGGAFIAASSLPTRTTVDLAPSGGGTGVTVTATDSVGLGVKTGMKGKYERWTGEITAAIRDACSSAGPPPG